MDYTPNYNLKKPGQDDFYNIEDFNENADIIDQKLKEIEDKTNNIEVPVTSINGKTGDVQLIAEDVGAETPEGAQAKANIALDTANQYTDQVAGVLSTQMAELAPKYGVASGTNTYTVTIDNTPSLSIGLRVAVKFTNSNTGASTLNINGLGAKPIVKAGGTALSSGNLKANGVYTLVYDGTNFQLQGEGASGNATASDLLSGKTATTDAGLITGTMANRGAVNASIATEGGSYTIPAGYHNGSGKVTATYKAIGGNKSLMRVALQLIQSNTILIDINDYVLVFSDVYLYVFRRFNRTTIIRDTYNVSGTLVESITLIPTVAEWQVQPTAGGYGVFCVSAQNKYAGPFLFEGRRYNIDGTLLVTSQNNSDQGVSYWVYTNGSRIGYSSNAFLNSYNSSKTLILSITNFGELEQIYPIFVSENTEDIYFIGTNKAVVIYNNGTEYHVVEGRASNSTNARKAISTLISCFTK